MKSEIEIIADMLFATFYSKDIEERNKLTRDWNRSFLLTITDQNGSVLGSVQNGEIKLQALKPGETPKYDFELKGNVENLTKFTVYSSYGLKDWLKRFANILLRRISYSPFLKIRDVIRFAKLMGV